MRDILPDEAELRDWMAQTILEVYRAYGFRRIETPALEHIELLTRGEGGENEKLIFKVLKRGEKLDLTRVAGEADLVDLGLRFDLTVPLARYYAQNHAKLPKPLKAIQLGPVWRAERPQKGRFRQFTQCDIDILGVESEAADWELILATSAALNKLKLGDLTIRLNDRRILVGMARAAGFAPERYDSVFIALDKWDKIGAAGVQRELEEEGHPADAIKHVIQRFDKGEYRFADFQDVGAHDAVEALKRIVDVVRAERVSIEFDPRLVRGMSYYTGPIFEIASARYPSSLAGGGRYDELIGKILGHDVPATGFSIGFERVASILLDDPPDRGQRKRVALVVDEANAGNGAVLARAKELRETHDVSIELRAKRFGAQKAALAAQGFDYVVDGPAGTLQPLANSP
jgi:histidyl-tRNA synthetase